MKRALAVGGALALVAAFVILVWQAFELDPHAVPFGLAGKPAPPFRIKRLDTNEDVTLASFKGKPVVINFWATWCGPCKQEHPVIEAAAKRFGDKVAFLGIVFEDTEENTRRFLQENGWSITQLFDPKSTVAVDYGVAGVPETYFITKEGVISSKYAAPIDPLTMKARLADVLGDPKIDATVSEALTLLVPLKLKIFDRPGNSPELLAKGLAVEGHTAAEIVEAAKDFEARLQEQPKK